MHLQHYDINGKLILFENSYVNKLEDWFQTKEGWHQCQNSKEEIF